MPTKEAQDVFNRWVEIGQQTTNLIMQPGLCRYKAGSHIYEIEIADKEMSDGGLTGWTYRVIKYMKVPMGFWRILGDGRVHTYPIFSKEVFT